MKQLGTDVLALLCIAGGAAVGGVATMGMMHDGGHDHHQHRVEHQVECAVVSEVDTGADVVVSIGGDEQRIVVASPRVRMHQPHCVQLESFGEGMHEVIIEEMSMKQELAMMEAERLQAMMELEAVELDNLSITLGSLGMDLDLGKEISEEIQFELQHEMELLEKELKRLEEIRR